MEKDDIEDKKATPPLVLIQDFTDKLTIRRILNVLIAGTLALLLYTAYEYRGKIFNSVIASVTQAEPTDWEISHSEKDLRALVDNNEMVKFVLVTQVDLRKNRRVPRFWHLDDPDVSLIKQKAAQLLPQAVFDYDEKNTQQMVAVLNNEFVCSKYEDTIYMRHFPELQKRMPYICRIAIPPFYGRFVGILTFGLALEPTKDQIDGLRLEASRLAVQIYIHDVIKNAP